MWTDRRWRRAFLILSLLLNVFFVGIIAGHLWASPQAAPRHGDLPVVPLVNLKALEADQRKVFGATMASHRETIRAARQGHRRIKLATEADIAAETFDATKVSADLTALREASLAVQSAANAALLDALGKLSPASRAALVNDEFRDPPPSK